MANDRPANAAEQGDHHEWPLKFSRHSFGVYTYETYGAQVEYAGRLQADESETTLKKSAASIGHDYQNAWSGGHGGIPNFPGPAKLRWRSKDGVEHRTTIDIGALFADQVVRHNVPESEHKPQPSGSYQPHIAVEINDRTVRVYMRAMVFTRQLQDPGNRYSGFRTDPVLVEELTF